MRFQNGFNKVVIELRVVQFWSEIIRVISKSNEHSTQLNYHYKSTESDGQDSDEPQERYPIKNCSRVR